MCGRPTGALLLLDSLKKRRRFRVTRYTAHASVFISCRNFSHGSIWLLLAAKPCACALRESIRARRRQHGDRQFAKPTHRYQKFRHDRNNQRQDETTRRLEKLGHAANLCACAGFEFSGEDDKHGDRRFANTMGRYECGHDRHVLQR